MRITSGMWAVGLGLVGLMTQPSCKARKGGESPSHKENQTDVQTPGAEAAVDEGGPTFGYPTGEDSASVVPSGESEGLGLAGIVNPYPRYLTKFLGDGYGTALRYSPRYRFRYYDNGFSPQTPQAAADMRAKMTTMIGQARSRGVPEPTIKEFESYVLGIAGNPNQLGDHIDQAYEEVHRKWVTCGGKFERVAKAANTGLMIVTAQPAPFYLCGTNAGCTFAAAMQNGLNPAQVHASISYIAGWDSQPTKSWFVPFKNLVRWEFGNWFGRLSGHVPSTVAQEYGDKPPCGYADDRTPPAVGISSPANNATVTGVVVIKASATDNLGVKDVKFFVDNVAVATDVTAPYEFSWNSATVANGLHVIKAVATDITGLSSAVQLNLRSSNRSVVPPPAPAVDSIKPVTTLTSLRDAATVSGQVSIAANATDNVGVAHVNFFVDGRLMLTDNAAPYAYTWDSTVVPNGRHVIMAAAADAAGLWSSATATVTTQNASAPAPADTIPPVTTLTAPQNGAVVSGIVTVTANATDNVAVALVNFFVDNSFVATDATAPYSFTWDSRTVPNGTHELMVAAADAPGLYTMSRVTVTVRN